MKAAIIGSGAAAVGALRALEEWRPESDVTMIDIGEEAAGPFETNKPPDTWTEEYYRSLYAHLREEHGLSFPPPKTNFGRGLTRYEVDGKKRIVESRWRGGLTNVWGGSILPFTDRELGAWPVDAAELAPYYRRIAEMVGIAGRRDGMSAYFEEDYVNRPPFLPLPEMDALEKSILNQHSSGSYQLIAGMARMALETRDDRPDRCIHSGECMLGCSQNAIYSAARDIDRFQSGGLIRRYIRGKVLRLSGKRLDVLVGTGKKQDRLGPFDKIYLCAGCAGSTEIVMRSLGLDRGVFMADNAVYTFPILHLGARTHVTPEEGYFGLTNLLVGCVPTTANQQFALIQVYPSFDHLWRYFVPIGMWDAFRGLGRFLRRRLLVARLYLHSDYSPRYELWLDDDRSLRFRLAKPAVPLRRVTGLMDSIRNAIGREGFFVPRLPPIAHASGTHYAATLPVGGDGVPVSATSEVMPGVYLCDSSTFADSPAISPTFTTMANACRVVHASLHD